MHAPMSREVMQTLKATKEEELRIEKVKRSVTHIYVQAVRQAETTSITPYTLHIGQEYQFYKDNMEEILTELQSLFPDCIVKLSKMCMGNDRKPYDISTIDEKMLPFINQKNAFECIVVDWT